MLRRELPPTLSPALVAGLPLRFLPAAPLSWLLRRATAMVRRRYPDIGERMAGCSGRLLIDPADLPLAVVLELADGIERATVVVQGRSIPSPVDASVRGSLADLATAFAGTADGDALFFSRRLEITGDMEIVVGLRNALDGAGIDMGAAFAGSLGPLGTVGGWLADRAVGDYRRAEAALSFLSLAANAPVRERVEAQAAEVARLKADIDELRTRPGRLRTRQMEPQS